MVTCTVIYELIFVEVKKVVAESKRTYEPIDDDMESPATKRNKIYKKLQNYIPKAVGILYWKQEKKNAAHVEADRAGRVEQDNTGHIEKDKDED